MMVLLSAVLHWFCRRVLVSICVKEPDADACFIYKNILYGLTGKTFTCYKMVRFKFFFYLFKRERPLTERIEVRFSYFKLLFGVTNTKKMSSPQNYKQNYSGEKLFVKKLFIQFPLEL